MKKFTKQTKLYQYLLIGFCFLGFGLDIQSTNIVIEKEEDAPCFSSFEKPDDFINLMNIDDGVTLHSSKIIAHVSGGVYTSTIQAFIDPPYLPTQNNLVVVLGSNIEVTTTADNIIAGDGFCTLHEAIANANGDNDTTNGDCACGDGAD